MSETDFASRELRLRARIDTLTDERDQARTEATQLRTYLNRAYRRTDKARAIAATWRTRALQGRPPGRATPRAKPGRNKQSRQPVLPGATDGSDKNGD